VVSYELCLKRGDSILAVSRLKGSERISRRFKQQILKISQSGDELCAMNIYFKNESGILFKEKAVVLYLFGR